MDELDEANDATEVPGRRFDQVLAFKQLDSVCGW